jgi:bacterioferritin-associated ferredoxin
MFVCICRVVTQSRIHAVIAAGANTVDEVTNACGAGGDCGSCRDEIQSMIDEHGDSDGGHCPRRRSANTTSIAR